MLNLLPLEHMTLTIRLNIPKNFLIEKTNYFNYICYKSTYDKELSKTLSLFHLKLTKINNAYI